LKRIYFVGDAPTLGAFAFRNCDNTTVYYRPGTTGWGSIFGGRPAVLWNPSFGGIDCGVDAVSCTVTGTPSIPIAVEFSSNLLSNCWIRLVTTNLTGGSFDLYHSGGTNYPYGFYRTVGP